LAKSIFGKIGIGDRSAPSNKITLCNEYRFYREGNQDHTKTSFDIFSFGVIMYFIFSDGKNMFSSAETLKKLILKREDFNKYLNNNDKFAGIKDSIKDIIIKCVSYDEKTRYCAECLRNKIYEIQNNLVSGELITKRPMEVPIQNDLELKMLNEEKENECYSKFK